MRVHASIEPLVWESDFFQLESAKLHFDSSAAPVAEADLDAYALVQAKIPAYRLGWADALSTLGFRLVEGEVDLVVNVAPESAMADAASAVAVRQAVPEDIPSLRAAAGEVFAASRFRAPWYDRADSGRFYAAWIEKRCRAPLIINACWCWIARGNPKALSACVTLAARKCALACWRRSPAHPAGAWAPG